MSQIALIACSKQKAGLPMQAQHMYQGDLFKYSMKYALYLKADERFILSAKYGLLSLEEEIMPYNETLNEMSALERQAWGKKVLNQLKEVSDLNNDFYILLAGKKYRTPIQHALQHSIAPLEGFGIGEQLSYIKKQCGKI